MESLRNPAIRQNDEVERAVDEIIENVRSRGDDALIEYARKFDRAEISGIAVEKAEIDAAWAACDAQLLDSLRLAGDNIRAFHSRQVRPGFAEALANGCLLGQRVIPLNRVGVYVPGGTARYPSTVLMNAIPAALAGVGEVILATPPGPNGRVPAAILAAAKLAGVERVVRAGGAQAIAALALGTKSVPAVDKIVGPGNVYVATAKRRVYGIVDIDMIAGPSEILIVADAASNPEHLAADLLSQAEHDEDASAVLITDSEKLAAAARDALYRRLATLPRAAIAARSIERNGRILLVDDLDQAIDIANRIAPEHLELCVDDPFALLGKVRHAGSVFLGRYAPEALGDYWAGPNHTLPTSGTARFSSPLSVDDFVKKSSYIYYTREALQAAAPHVIRLAECEGLSAHARSVAARLEVEP
ncbi:MAG: histidinol dehydrogenase [Clostridiales bacterium]|nr:histidinol dehydrogenase [Clostridiales bacterium]